MPSCIYLRVIFILVASVLPVRAFQPSTHKSCLTGVRRIGARSTVSSTVLHAKHNQRVRDYGPEKEDKIDESISGPMINWYPGHIARAERTLQEHLKLVDVVVEVRDARIPRSTTHPLVPEWVGNRPLIVVFSRTDVASPKALDDWKRYLTREKGMADSGRGGNVPVFFVNAKTGREVYQVKKAVLKAGAVVNEKRIRRGINPRSVRAAVIGYPNVGKSALINQLVGKSVAKSMNIPGVTRKIRWIRLNSEDSRPESELELLDSPGIIPAKQEDQESALKLAICNDIGQASYDPQLVSAAMVDALVDTAIKFRGYIDLAAVETRYGIDPRRHTGSEFLYLMAAAKYQGNVNSAADRLLGDFRKGYLGKLTLEAPPTVDEIRGIRREISKENNPIRAEAPLLQPDYGKAAMEEREFIGAGDFEGW